MGTRLDRRLHVPPSPRVPPASTPPPLLSDSPLDRNPGSLGRAIACQVLPKTICMPAALHQRGTWRLHPCLLPVLGSSLPLQAETLRPAIRGMRNCVLPGHELLLPFASPCQAGRLTLVGQQHLEPLQHRDHGEPTCTSCPILPRTGAHLDPWVRLPAIAFAEKRKQSGGSCQPLMLRTAPLWQASSDDEEIRMAFSYCVCLPLLPSHRL
mmetsp:Transcript_43969/g.101499  ORF Transcript_43969/g.101499 Transcript_43969/m.101499 type:complete len:210 (-) Transcript_43969:1880-2509(-)